MNKRWLLYLLPLVFLIALFIAFNVTSGNASADTHVWTKEGADALASNALNWRLSSDWSQAAPTTGDDILYNTSGGANACTWNIADTFATFTMAAGYTGTISPSVAFSVTNFTMSAGTFSASTTATNWLTITTDWYKTAGTWTADRAYVEMTGTNNVINLNAAMSVRVLWLPTGAAINITSSSNFAATKLLQIDTGAALTTSTAYEMDIGTTVVASSTVIQNYGTFTWIGGNGVLIYYTASCNIAPLGNITANKGVGIQLSSAAAASRIATITALPFYVIGPLKVGSDHATYTGTLDLHGYSISVTNYVLARTRGVITDSVGGSTITATAVYVNGTSAVLTQGAGCAIIITGTLGVTSGGVTQAGAISVSGVLTVSGGTLAGSTSYVLTCSDNFVYSSGTVTTNVLQLTMAGTTKTLSLPATNLYALTINGATTTTSTFSIINTLTTAVSTAFTINTAGVVTLVDGTLSNSGSIAGTGIFTYERDASDATVTFGVINCPSVIQAGSSAATNRVVTLGLGTGFGSSLVLVSQHGTYTCTLDIVGYTLTTASTDVQVRGILTGNGGTISPALTISAGTLSQTGPLILSSTLTVSGGTVTETDTISVAGALSETSGTFTLGSILTLSSGGAVSGGTFTGAGAVVGALTISGTGILTQTGTITLSSLLTISGGTLTGVSPYWFITSDSVTESSGTLTTGTVRLQMTGTSKTLTLVAGQDVLDLNIHAGSTITLATNVIVKDILSVDGALTQSTYRINVTSTTTNALYINGTFDGDIYLDGGVVYSAAVTLPLGGYVWVDTVTTFNFASAFQATPDNWIGIALTSWNAANGSWVYHGQSAVSGANLTVYSNGFNASKTYVLYVDGSSGSSFTSTAGGYLTWWWTGPWSGHIFNFSQVNYVVPGDATWAWGGGDHLASTDANWANGSHPGTATNVWFISGSDACTWDIAATFGNFVITAGYSGTVTQGAVDFGYSDFSMAGGTWTGTTSKWQTGFGNWIYSGGAISFSVLNLNLTGIGKTLTWQTGRVFYSLTITGTYTATGSAGSNLYVYYVIIGINGHLTINSGLIFRPYVYVGSGFSNLGIIDGAGTLDCWLYDADKTIIFGTVNCPVIVNLYSSPTASHILSLTANASLGSTLTIKSDSATYIMTLNLNGKSLTATSITAGTRGIITDSVGGGTVTCTSFTQNGVSSATTIAGTWNVNGAVSITAGTFTGSASYNFICTSSFSCSGTLTADVLQLIMTTDATTLTLPNVNIYALTTNGSVSTTSTFSVISGLTVAGGKIFTVNTGTITLVDVTLSNSGTITGTGNIIFDRKSSDVTYTFGTINTAVILEADSTTVANRVVTLGASVTFGSTLTIQSLHASHTITLALNGFNLQCTALTVTDRGVLSGVGQVTCTAFTQNGVTSSVTMGGTWIVNGAWSQVDGTFTGSTSYTLTCSDNFISSSGTVTANVLRLIMTGANKIVTLPNVAIYTLSISNPGTTASTFSIIYTLSTSNPFTISSPGVVTLVDAGFYNSGSVVGTGTLVFDMKTTNQAYTFGTVSCPVIIQADAAANASRIVTLSEATAVFGSTLTILSNSATYTMTVELNGESLSAANVMISNEGSVRTSVNGGNITCAGVYFNGTNPVLTQSANCGLTINGNLYINTGYVNQSGTIWVNGNYNQASGTLNGDGVHSIITSGNVDMNVTSAVLMEFICTGASKYINGGYVMYQVLNFTGSYTSLSTLGVETLQVSGSLTISTGNAIIDYGLTSDYITGSLLGGTWEWRDIVTGTYSPNLSGTITSVIYVLSDVAANETITLGTDVVTTGPFIIDSSTSYYVDLDLNGYVLSSSFIEMRTYSNITLSGGSITTSDYIYGDHFSLLDATAGGSIDCGGNWDTSLGNFIGGTSLVYLSGVGATIKANSSDSFYDLDLGFGSSAAQTSDLVVNHRLVVDGALAQGTYKINVTSGLTDPLYILGSFDGAIYLNGTAVSYTAQIIPMPMVGSVWTNRSTTIFTATVMFNMTTTEWTNVSLISWNSLTDVYRFWASSGVVGANVTYNTTVDGAYSHYTLKVDGVFYKVFTLGALNVTQFYYAGPWTVHDFVLDPNASWAPTFTSVPVGAVQVGTTYYYNVTTNESATFSLFTNITGLSINGTSGEITGVNNTTSSYFVNVSATSIAGFGVSYQNYTLDVALAVITVNGTVIGVTSWALGVNINYTLGLTTVSFNFTIHNLYGVKLVTTMWNFGDGVGSNAQFPVHAYDSSGWYQVTVYVKDAIGRIGTQTVMIKVGTPGGGAPPVEIRFYYWLFTAQAISLLGALVVGLVGAFTYDKFMRKYRGGPNLMVLVLWIVGMIVLALYFMKWGTWYS
jgi:hypothetical protein